MKYMREEKKAKRVLSTLPPGGGRQRRRGSPPERREGKEVEAAQEGRRVRLQKVGMTAKEEEEDRGESVS